jgi:hypothetical protein
LPHVIFSVSLKDRPKLTYYLCGRLLFLDSQAREWRKCLHTQPVSMKLRASAHTSVPGQRLNKSMSLANASFCASAEAGPVGAKQNSEAAVARF